MSNICTYTAPDVAADPFLEDVDQEASVAVGVTERAVTTSPSCTYRGRSRHEDHGTVPSCVGLGDALDDGDELHEARAALVAQEAVDLAAAMLVGGVDGA